MRTGSALFVDADKALVSSRPEDLDYIRSEIRKREAHAFKSMHANHELS